MDAVRCQAIRGEAIRLLGQRDLRSMGYGERLQA
jgi:hypothetical protein